MMVYAFDEELKKMVYRFEAEPEATIITDSGKDWYKEQVKIADEVGNKHYQKLLADLANEMYKEEN